MQLCLHPSIFMEEVDVPRYFLCPISLQIMKDPVTTISGITYDRECIEQWLIKADESMCPVTKQPLPRDSDLTPNHTLRRLIQAWCVANAKHGVDRIPTPKSPLSKSHIYKLVRDLNVPVLQLNSLKRIEGLAMENDKNRKCLLESGVAKAMVSFIVKCYKEKTVTGLAEALMIFQQIWSPTPDAKLLVCENYDLVESLTWILNTSSTHDFDLRIRSLVVIITRHVIKVSSSSIKERLKSDFFSGMVVILRDLRELTEAKENKAAAATATIKSALRTLVDVSQFGRNRFRMIEANAIHELIELEFGISAERKVTDLVFCLMAHLCTCAEGRAQFLGHSAAIPLVSKRMLRVSTTTDDRAVQIFTMIAKYSSTSEVFQDMLKFGAVSKLCMVLQTDCAKYLKDRAREILRVHCNVWKSSPCLQLYVVSR